jgi:NADH-quinone oxidoreductase subunit J
MSAVLFFIAAIGAIAGAIGVVTLRNPFYSVLSLVVHLICLAVLFLLLRAEFVVAYVGGGEQMLGGAVLRVLGPLFALALAIELCIATLGSALKGVSGKGAPYVAGFGTPAHIGSLFLTKYLFPFEVASILLLVAAVGAVVLARRRRGLEGPDEQLALQIRAPRPAWTGTMAEAAGTRIVENAPEPEHVGDVSTREGGW